jgi:hypothetical protein
MRSRLAGRGGGGSAMTKEVFRPASKLTDIKPNALAGREERSIQRPCSKVTFMQPYGVLELRYYLGMMTMSGSKRWH